MVALLEFQERAVDYAVMEVGLGGRLDATNILNSEYVACTAVTSIGRDHEEILGTALEDIAYEKAGIIKNGVQGCVVGPTAAKFDVFSRSYEQAGGPAKKFVEVNLPMFIQ